VDQPGDKMVAGKGIKSTELPVQQSKGWTVPIAPRSKEGSFVMTESDGAEENLSRNGRVSGGREPETRAV